MTTDPQVALVTGGSRGIGRAIVEALLRRGLTVWFCGRDAEALRDAEAELGKRYPTPVHGLVCDVRDYAAVAALVAEIVDTDGRLDVLVDDAGLGYFAPVDEMEPEQFREVLEVNLFGAFHGIRAAGAVMGQAGAAVDLDVAPGLLGVQGQLAGCGGRDGRKR